MYSRMTKKLLGVAVVGGMLLVSNGLTSLVGAEPNQKIGKMDTTVMMENAGVAATTVLGGKADVNVGSAVAQDGSQQDIGEFKANVTIKNAGVAATTVLGGKAQANIGSAIAKKGGGILGN